MAKSWRPDKFLCPSSCGLVIIVHEKNIPDVISYSPSGLCVLKYWMFLSYIHCNLLCWDSSTGGLSEVVSLNPATKIRLGSGIQIPRDSFSCKRWLSGAYFGGAQTVFSLISLNKVNKKLNKVCLRKELFPQVDYPTCLEPMGAVCPWRMSALCEWLFVFI